MNKLIYLTQLNSAMYSSGKHPCYPTTEVIEISWTWGFSNTKTFMLNWNFQRGGEGVACGKISFMGEVHVWIFSETIQY